MRPLLAFTFALSACARPVSAPVAAVHTAAPRVEPAMSLSRFEPRDENPLASRRACSIGPSELACETKLLASVLRATPATPATPATGARAAPEVQAITREDGSVLYAQALRTGVSQARLRSSLPVTARR